MKKITKTLAGLIISVMLVGATGVMADPADADTTSETTSETASTEDSSAASSESVKTVPETNENGEYTINGNTFETMYGSQLGTYLNHQYYYDGIEVPIAESNFYFIHTFTELSNNAIMGYYPMTSEGFVDLAYELPKGELDSFSFSILGDYFKEYSENQILSTYIVLDMAREEEVVLTDELNTEIDGYMETLEDVAKQEALSLDDYLALFYGKECTAEEFRGILERYYLSSLYSDTYIENYDYSDEDIYLPSVCHMLFEAREGVADEAAMAQAKADAEAALAQCKNPNDITTNGTKLKEEGKVAEVATYQVPKGRFVQEFEDWAYDPARKVGDMGIVQTMYGYHVIGYIGVEEMSEEEKKDIALQALNDEVGSIAMSDVHQFYTNDTIETPEKLPTIEESMIEVTDVSTSATAPSLQLDENGNIAIEETGTSDSTEPQITAKPITTSKELSMVRKISIGAAAVVLVAIIILVISLVSKNKKLQDEVLKNAELLNEKEAESKKDDSVEEEVTEEKEEEI